MEILVIDFEQILSLSLANTVHHTVAAAGCELSEQSDQQMLVI